MGLFTQLGRDITYIRALLRLKKHVQPLTEDRTLTAADMIERWARETPNKEAILYEDRSVTYGEYDAAGERYAQWGLAQGLKKGDVVALLMENRPEYLFAWLGMAKIGVTTALINTNQTGLALAHSVNIAKAKLIIVGIECQDNYNSGKDQFESELPVWSAGGTFKGAENLDAALAGVSSAPVGKQARAGLTSDDNCFYIYTSGTTGLPKAARFSHGRFWSGIGTFTMAANVKQTDRVYDCLPMYHSAGGVVAPGMAFFVGATLVIARKFSVRNFWSDCAKYKVTVVQYIGELCRYLLNADPHPDERNHKIRVILGNGLRPEVWGPFQTRFNIPQVREFYAATEGLVAFLNFDGTPGAVGRIPSFAKALYENVKFVKFDVDTEQPVRGPDGFCVECEPGEVGEPISRILDEPGGGFEGYGDKAANEKKLLRNVFEEGDVYYRSGDLLKVGEKGYVYFVDRIGDTFRWKGENVATSEVAEALSVFDGIEEANVYGVHVPGADGKAGMAALVTEGALNLDALAAHLGAQLPAYARPMFIRLLPEMEITGTFKHRKVDLQKEGFDPSAIEDDLFFYDDVAEKYVPLTADLYDRICGGSLRL